MKGNWGAVQVLIFFIVIQLEIKAERETSCKERLKGIRAKLRTSLSFDHNDHDVARK